MKLQDAISSHKSYLKSFAKQTSQDAYHHLYVNLLNEFSDRDIESLKSDEIFSFLNKLTDRRSQATKRLRYQQIKAVVNFCIQNLDVQMKQVCSSPMLKQAYRAPKKIHKQLPDRDQIDEIIYKTDNVRTRLMLSILAYGALRIGELLKLKPSNVMGSKLILENPKSGKAFETAYLPNKIAQRLHQYIKDKGIGPDERIWPISYSGARSIMNNINKKFGTHIRLHDLRRFAATHASRAGMPLEVISKALLRHSSTYVASPIMCSVIV